MLIEQSERKKCLSNGPGVVNFSKITIRTPRSNNILDKLPFVLSNYCTVYIQYIYVQYNKVYSVLFPLYCSTEVYLATKSEGAKVLTRFALIKAMFSCPGIDNSCCYSC